MPPKYTHTRVEIIQAAFEVIREKGLAELSARHVAQRLNSSVAPVYSYYASMDELRRDALLKAKELLFVYATRPYSERVFLNLGMGAVLFARDESRLFRALFLECGQFKDILDGILATMREEMDKDQRAVEMSPEAKDTFLRQMFVFTYGLATLVCVDLVADRSDEYIRSLLERVGAVILKSATGGGCAASN